MKTPIISKKYVMIWRRLRWSGTRPKKVIHHEATFCESAFLWNFFFLGSRHLQGVFLVQPNRFRSYLFLPTYNGAATTLLVGGLLATYLQRQSASDRKESELL